MTRQSMRYIAVTVVCGCLAVSGCGHPNAFDLAADFVAESQPELATLAFFAPSADVRRESMVTMSYRWWGMRPTVLKGYALAASNSKEEPTVRCVALRALAQAGPGAEPHIEEILKALDAKSRHVRWDAAVALDEIWVDTHRSRLARLMSTLSGGYSDAQRREQAAAMNETWGKKVIVRLVAHLRWDPDTNKGDPSIDVRTACAEALRSHRLTDVIAVLADVLDKDDDHAVRRQAHASLVELVGVDRGWNRADWQGDTVVLAPIEPKKAWWDPLGVFTGKSESDAHEDDPWPDAADES